MKIKALKGPEPGKKVLRLNDGGGLFLRVTKHTDKKGVERVSKSWEFFFTINNKTSCTGLGPYAPAAKAPGLQVNFFAVELGLSGLCQRNCCSSEKRRRQLVSTIVCVRGKQTGIVKSACCRIHLRYVR